MRAVMSCGTALLCAALFSTQASAATAPPAPVDPVAQMVGLQTQIQQLYHQAEQATERYNSAEEQLGEQQNKVNDVRAGIVWAQQNVDQLHDQMGRLARLQYTTDSADPLLSLMMSSDPSEFLSQAPMFEHITQTQSDTIARAKAAAQQLKAMQKSVDEDLAESQQLEQDAASAQTDIQNKVNQAQAILGTLTPAQLQQLNILDEQAAQAGQQQLSALGILNRPDQLTTPAALRALQFAISKLGIPYVWGGIGPNGYDCSGLTSQAWHYAGVDIPRTSQEQWAELPRVPLADIRPGDLIVYFADASHVAMYLGAGLIIQAPRPGRYIEISQAGGMPILGVVRPEGGPGTVTGPGVPANVPTTPTNSTTPPTSPPTTTPPTQTPPTTPTPTPSDTPPSQTPPPSGTPSGTPSDTGSGTPSGTGSGTPSGTGTGSGTPSATETPAPSSTSASTGTTTSSSGPNPSAT